MKNLQTIPKNYKTIGTVMTNCDHTIESEAEDILKAEEVYGEYKGWNFWGAVWFDRVTENFMCMVKQYNSHVNTVIAKSLNKIMKLVSDKYGYE